MTEGHGVAHVDPPFLLDKGDDVRGCAEWFW